MRGREIMIDRKKGRELARVGERVERMTARECGKESERGLVSVRENE